MAIDGGNLLERAVSVWGTEDVRKGVELSLEKQLQQNRDELSSIENPTEGDREYHNEVEQEIRQKHKEALAKIDQLKEVGKPEEITTAIELDPTLPEGYELPGQPQVETEVNIPELPKPTKQEEIQVQKDAIETEKQQAITEATKPVVDLELLGDETQAMELITEKASGDKDGGKAKIRQHERIRVRLQALKDLIDCV